MRALVIFMVLLAAVLGCSRASKEESKVKEDATSSGEQMIEQDQWARVMASVNTLPLGSSAAAVIDKLGKPTYDQQQGNKTTRVLIVRALKYVPREEMEFDSTYSHMPIITLYFTPDDRLDEVFSNIKGVENRTGK